MADPQVAGLIIIQRRWYTIHQSRLIDVSDQNGSAVAAPGGGAGGGGGGGAGGARGAGTPRPGSPHKKN